MFVVKQAKASDAAVTDGIMGRIYAENPSYWPYGVSRDHFDGGLYLVSKSASHEPVGFVGWQERAEAGRKIGYYSIGVLPEHRGNGYAQSAVSQMLREKAASVDEVRAMVMPHNEASKGLARAIPGVVLMEKSAALDPKTVETLKTLLATAGGAAMGGPGFDNFTHGANKSVGDTFNEAMGDDHRKHQMGWNSVLGGAAGLLGAKKGPTAGISAMLAVPGKDLIMSGNRTLQEVDAGKVNNALDAAAQPAPDAAMSPAMKKGLMGLGVAGVAGGGFVAYKLLKALQERNRVARAGRVKVTLGTKEPGDAETVLDLPMEDVRLSKSLYGRLGRDARGRLLEETRKRTKRVSPNKKNPNPREQEIIDINREAEEMAREEEAGLEKVSAFRKLAAANTAVPSPPVQGVNPALRMTQEKMTAQAEAQGAGTQANPQIEAAEQNVAAAEQAAQAQVSQAQQAAQNEIMQADSARQQQQMQADQEAMKLKQENEILKMKAEKAKIEGELANKHKDLEAAGATRDNKNMMQMTKRRLNRVRSRITVKQAAAQAPAPTAPTPPAPPASTQRLAPWAGQRINAGGSELMARGRLMPTHLYRASYGKPLDTAYDWLFRKPLMTPSQGATVDPNTLPAGVLAGNPDAYGMLMRGAQDTLHRPRF